MWKTGGKTADPVESYWKMRFKKDNILYVNLIKTIGYENNSGWGKLY